MPKLISHSQLLGELSRLIVEILDRLGHQKARVVSDRDNLLVINGIEEDEDDKDVGRLI